MQHRLLRRLAWLTAHLGVVCSRRIVVLALVASVCTCIPVRAGASVIAYIRWEQAAFGNPKTRGAISLYDVDTGRTRVLTELTAPFGLDWAPDGRRLAVVSGSPTPRLGLLSVLTGELELIPQEDERPNYLWPRWSPDGAQIIYLYSKNGQMEALDALDVRTRATRRLIPWTDMPRDPDWSPDGTQLVFAAPDRPRTSSWDVFVMDSGGGPWTNLTRLLDAEEEQPAWSPDGREIVYVRTTWIQPGDQIDRSLFVLDIATGVTRRLTEPPFRAEWPAWSPDGEQIAFSAVPEGRDVYNIHVIDRDGRGLRQLTNFDLTPAVHPAWFYRDVLLAVSPKGKAAATWGSIKQGSME
jgi:Tol biopolymer transport system component